MPPDKPYIPIRNQLMAQKNQPKLTQPQHNLNEREHASLLKERRESDDIGFELITNWFTVFFSLWSWHSRSTPTTWKHWKLEVVNHGTSFSIWLVADLIRLVGIVLYLEMCGMFSYCSRQSHAQYLYIASGPKGLSGCLDPQSRVMHRYSLFSKTSVRWRADRFFPLESGLNLTQGAKSRLQS
jgi:hypothetical protein